MDESINDNQTKNTVDANSASPNIKSSTDESAVTEQDAKPGSSNPTEKVEVDHIPIAEKDIEFHSKDIKIKDSSNLFVNVSDAKKVAKTKEHERILAEKQKAKEDEEKRRIIEHEKAEKEKAETAAKEIKKREEEQKIEAAKAKIRKDERNRKRQQRKEIKTTKRAKRHKFLKKYRFLILAIVVLLIAAGIAVTWTQYYKENRIAITGIQNEEDFDAVRVKMFQLYYGNSETDISEIVAKTDISYSNSESEQYKKTAKYLDDVINSTKDTRLRLEAVFLKINMLLDSKQFDKAKKMLNEIDEKELDKNQSGKYYSTKMRYAILTNDNEEEVKIREKIKELNGDQNEEEFAD